MTRHLKPGADRARQRLDMLMFDGTDIVRVVEATGARHESAGEDPEAESGPAAEEGVSDADEWKGWDMGDWKQDLVLVLVLRQRLVPGQRWLHQRRVLVLVLRRRRQGMLGWRHQMRHWSKYCRCVNMIWMQQME
jgi:hypothetical protein